jgi:hypothetical protein
VDPRAGLDDLEKRTFLTISELELRPLGRPARNQWLYRLSYPGSLLYSRQYYYRATTVLLSVSAYIYYACKENYQTTGGDILNIIND